MEEGLTGWLRGDANALEIIYVRIGGEGGGKEQTVGGGSLEELLTHKEVAKRDLNHKKTGSESRKIVQRVRKGESTLHHHRLTPPGDVAKGRKP